MQQINFDFEQQPGMRRWNSKVKTTESPLVSVITPYYNSGKHIHQTCNCVLNQTFPYFEWIIINDGSTKDEDLRILEEIGTMDPRIRVLHKQNGGPSIARNYGVRHAVADLILPLDADDLLEPTFIEYCWWMLKKNPGAAWAYTDSVGFQGQEYLWAVPFHPIRMKKENLLAITALIRKEVFLSIGGYSEEVKLYNEDWESWLKLIARGHYPVQCQGDYLFWYRRGGSGVQSSIQGNVKISEQNKKIIKDAAALVKNPKKPILYPKSFAYNRELPVLSEWNKCVYQEKTKKHILFLLPNMNMDSDGQFHLDLMANLDQNKYDFGIITTTQAPQSWQQAFRKVTPNVFNLANFADPKDYAEFISYYIKSRKVDILFLSNSYHGYYLIPWLREQFPGLVIVDYVHMEDWYWRNGGYARTSAMVGAITEKTYVSNAADRETIISHFQRKPESVETIHVGLDAEFTRLTEDPVLVAQRYETSLLLQKLKPLAAELYVAEMEFHCADTSHAGGTLEGLPQKIRQVYKEKGILGLAKKVLSKAKNYVFP